MRAAKKIHSFRRTLSFLQCCNIRAELDLEVDQGLLRSAEVDQCLLRSAQVDQALLVQTRLCQGAAAEVSKHFN